MNLKNFPAWYQKLPIALIQSMAQSYGLDPYLIAAIIKKESRGDTWASRYEPKNIALYEPTLFSKLNFISLETEKIHQSTSFGLMQVMGYIARIEKFQGQLTNLCDPVNGIDLGCKVLQNLFRAHSDLQDVIASYNAGKPRKDEAGLYLNQSYVSDVLANIKELNDAASKTTV